MTADNDLRFLPDELVALGQITRTQGHHGAVRMLPFFEPVTEFDKLPGRDLILRHAESTPGSPARYQQLHLEAFWYHQNCVILEFSDITDMTAAEKVRGATVMVREKDLWPLEEGEFFTHELKGFELVAPTGEKLGIVDSVESGAAHDFLRVVKDDGRRFLVPMVKTIVLNIDRSTRRVTADLPPGLDEL